MQEHFLRRIAWLEQLLEEEKKKSATVAHQANIQDARDQAAMTDDAKLFEREKEILQKEVKMQSHWNIFNILYKTPHMYPNRV